MEFENVTMAVNNNVTLEVKNASTELKNDTMAQTKLTYNLSINANYSIEAANVVHIANFPEFFKISAFFIAFVLLYLVTVPCFMHFIGKSWKVIGGLVAVLRGKGYSSRMINFLSVLWIFWIIILPLAAVIIWGMVLAWSPSFSI